MKIIDIATGNQPKKIRRVLILGFLNSLFKVLPYGVLIGAVLELFEPLLDSHKPLDISRLWLYFGLLILIYVIQFFIGRYRYITAFGDCTKLVADGRIRFAKHIRDLPMHYFTKYDSGQFSSYLLDDYENVLTLISDGLEPILSAIVMPLVAFISMSFINLKMALCMILPPLVAVPTVLLARKVSAHFGRKVIHSRTNASSRMLEYLNSIAVVKAFNLVGKKFKRLESSFDQLRKDSIRLEFCTGLGVVLGEMVVYAGIPLLLIFGLSMLVAGEISVPVYIMFLLISPKIYEPLATAITLSALISFYSQSALRIESINTIKPLPEPTQGKVPENHPIDFQHVTFKYENLNVINDVSFTIPEHSITALVGPSGSGKTTIARLIARFHDTDKGQISIGNCSLKDMTIDEPMNHISIVFQDVYLFHDTIMNNIRFGRKGATEEDVMDAAKAASCHTFIMALPDGYNTVIGEGGSTLSGGEKQRISIARAILKDSPIILLDEATASLDPENEVYIQRALNNLVKNKTLVVIAHRLKTIAHVDQILVLDDGRIVERGNHEELLQTNGLYSRMWHEQQKTKTWKI